jgi:hypothetical protein
MPATNTTPALASRPTDSQNRAGRRMVLRSASSRPRSSRWQDQADGDDHHEGPPGSREADGLDAEHPQEHGRAGAAEQDGGTQRERGGRGGHQQRHRQVQPADAARPGADRLHDADLGDLLGEQVVEHVGDQDRGQQQGGDPAGEQRDERRVGLPLVGVCVGFGHLDLADGQPVVLLQPRGDAAGDGHDPIAVPAGRGLAGVGDLELQLVQPGRRPGRGQRRGGQVAVALLLLGRGRQAGVVHGVSHPQPHGSAARWRDDHLVADRNTQQAERVLGDEEFSS